MTTAISVEPLSDGIGGDLCGFWTGGHVPRKKFIGACINFYKYEYGDDLTGLWQAEVEHVIWRESHDCIACDGGDDPPDAFDDGDPCHLCKGTGRMYDYQLVDAKPDEPGAFPATFVRFE